MFLLNQIKSAASHVNHKTTASLLHIFSQYYYIICFNILYLFYFKQKLFFFNSHNLINETFKNLKSEKTQNQRFDFNYKTCCF